MAEAEGGERMQQDLESDKLKNTTRIHIVETLEC